MNLDLCRALVLEGCRYKQVGMLDKEIAEKQKILAAATEKFVNKNLDKFKCRKFLFAVYVQ